MLKIINKVQIPTVAYALGGLEEIGKNTYVVEYKDEIIVIDAGIKFGINIAVIDEIELSLSLLVQHHQGIDSLVITHGHEDHIGGIPHLLRQVPLKKIYAPPLAIKIN